MQWSFEEREREKKKDLLRIFLNLYDFTARDFGVKHSIIRSGDANITMGDQSAFYHVKTQRDECIQRTVYFHKHDSCQFDSQHL